MNLAPHIAQHFFGIQSTLKPTVSVEVGAYEASFSINMVRQYKTKAWAFEANKYNYERCREVAESSGVTYLNKAVSSIVGDIPFKFQEGAPNEIGNNSILTRNGVNHREETVASTSLDAFFIDSGLVSEKDSVCLWIDVEGASKDVLLGGQKLLQQTTSVLIEVEHHPFWEGQWLAVEVNNFLTDSGFTLHARDFEYHPTQENFLFVKLPTP